MQVSLQMTMFVIGTFASEGGCAGFCAVRRVDAGGVPFLLLTTWSFLIFWYSRRYFSCLLHNGYKSTLPTRSAHAVFCLMCNRRPMSLCDVPNKDISISISSSGCNLIGNWNWDGHSFFETLAPSFRDSCLSPLGEGTNSTVPANNLSICLEAARTAQNQIDRETWAVDLMQLFACPSRQTRCGAHPWLRWWRRA